MQNNDRWLRKLKILEWTSVVLALVLALIFIRIGQNQYKKIHEGLLVQSSLRLNSTRQHVENYFYHVFTVLQMLSFDDEIIKLTTDSADTIRKIYNTNYTDNYMMELCIIKNDFDGSKPPFLLFNDCNGVWDTNPETQLSKYRVIIKHIKLFNDDPALQSLISNSITQCSGDPCLVLSVPVRDGNKVVGLISGAISVNKISSILEIGDEGYQSVMVCNTGDIYGCDNATIDTKSRFLELIHNENNLLPIDTDATRQSSFMNNNIVLYNQVNIPDNNQWYIGTVYDENKLLNAYFWNIFFYVYGPAIVFLLFAGLIVYLLRNMMALNSSRNIRAGQAIILQSLLELSQKLLNTDDLDDILQSAVFTTASLLSCRRVSIMLPDDDRQKLIVVSSVGLLNNTSDTITIPIDEGIAGEVFTTSRQILVNDLNEDMVRDKGYESPIFVSTPLVSTPLIIANGPIGVMNLTERCNREPFTILELEAINILSNIIASAIYSVMTQQSRDKARDSVVIALALLAERRDNETGKHLDRVTQYSMILARELMLHPRYADDIVDDKFLKDLERAAILHDIGKVAVPDSILLKPGKLTDDEMEVVKSHTHIGWLTLLSVTKQNPGATFLEMAANIAHYHHEKFDGSGYPTGISGKAIPLCARIVAAADVYDALRTRRPYKEAFSHSKTMTIINDSAGSHFDTDIIDALHNCESEFTTIAHELADSDNHSNTSSLTNAMETISKENQPETSLSSDNNIKQHFTSAGERSAA